MRFVHVKQCLLLALVVLVSGASSTAQQTTHQGQGPSLQSMGPLAFGPDGTLFAADNQAAAIFALTLGAHADGGAPGAQGLNALDQKLAALVGTGASEIAVTDLVVHPRTRNAYVSVMRGQGAGAAPVSASCLLHAASVIAATTESSRERGIGQLLSSRKGEELHRNDSPNGANVPPEWRFHKGTLVYDLEHGHNWLPFNYLTPVKLSVRAPRNAARRRSERRNCGMTPTLGRDARRTALPGATAIHFTCRQGHQGRERRLLHRPVFQ